MPSPGSSRPQETSAGHKGPEVSLRGLSQSEDDARLVWQWRNDPLSRAMSRTTDEIPWEQHWKWFCKTAQRKDVLHAMAAANGTPCGAVRFEKIGDQDVLVSLVIAPSHRGQGLAARVLCAGTSLLASNWPEIALVRAEIREDNLASIRSFERAGYRRSEEHLAQVDGGPGLGVWNLRVKHE